MYGNIIWFYEDLCRQGGELADWQAAAGQHRCAAKPTMHTKMFMLMYNNLKIFSKARVVWVCESVFATLLFTQKDLHGENWKALLWSIGAH